MFSYDLRHDKLTVRLDGELDHSMAARVRGELDRLIDDARVRRLVFDVSGLRFMDSSGIGLIIGRYKRVSRRGGSVAVTGQDRRIDRLFQMSGVYQVVERI
ncbi:MAG: anti-sigma factor antagonist [Clostridia bacterium]|nr:anti-sigma factor antagonist [Clostridia bacterium]